MSAKFRRVSSETRDLTRELALEFMNMKPSPTERELNSGRVAHLKNKAIAGWLVPFNWARARLGNSLMRMNGQHSSTMLCESFTDASFPVGLKVHIDDYEVDDEEGFAQLFRQFDDRRSGRSPLDVSRAYQMIFTPLREIPSGIAKLGAEGISYYLKRVEGQGQTAAGINLTGDDQYAMFGERMFHPFLQWIGGVLNAKTPEMKDAPIVAAMFGAFDANQEEARAFWDQVSRRGVQNDDTAPSTVLDAWLLEAVKNNEIKDAHLYEGCVFAWNSYRTDKAIKGIKYDTRKGFSKIAE